MISKKVKRILIVSPLLILILGLIYWYNPTIIDFLAASGTKPQLTDLHEFALLRNAFESDSGYVRLITQLAPT